MPNSTNQPQVPSGMIYVTRVTGNSISIQWEAAADNVTSKANIRYEVWFKLSDTPSDPWHCVYEKMASRATRSRA